MLWQTYEVSRMGSTFARIKLFQLKIFYGKTTYFLVLGCQREIVFSCLVRIKNVKSLISKGGFGRGLQWASNAHRRRAGILGVPWLGVHGVEGLKREVVGGKQFMVDRICFTAKHLKLLKMFYIETNRA